MVSLCLRLLLARLLDIWRLETTCLRPSRLLVIKTEDMGLHFFCSATAGEAYIDVVVAYKNLKSWFMGLPHHCRHRIRS